MRLINTQTAMVDIGVFNPIMPISDKAVLVNQGVGGTTPPDLNCVRI
jgi:hypothetical protein